jgi:hypothetical protein
VAAESSIFVLEVQGGRALPEAIRLHRGRPLQPMSIGSRGQWHIAGPRVREVHGYVRFDGAHVYVRSDGEEDPLRMNGAPVGRGWVRLSPPCRVTAGEVTLALSATAAPDGIGDDATPPPGEPAPDLEATRVDPVEVLVADDVLATCFDAAPFAFAAAPTETAGAGGPVASAAANEGAATRIEAGAVMLTPPTRTHLAVNALVPIDVPPPLPVKPAPAGERHLAALREHWRRTSGVQKATLFLLPFAFLAVGGLFAERRPSIRRGAPAAVAAAPVPVATLVRAASSSAIVPPPAPTAPTSVGGGKTLARIAADAVAIGAYTDAVIRYDDLARTYPDRPAYREAARILRSKLDAGTPALPIRP